MQRYDYIIVGAGSAGCVVANRLTEDPSCRVLLLEAGGSASTPLVSLAFGFAFMLNNPRYDWRFEIGPEAELNGKMAPYPRGRILGGSSSINAMLYVRGFRDDYNGWKKQGLTGWGWEDVEPYLCKLEDYPEQSPWKRGRGGPVKVSRSPNYHSISARMVEAAGTSSVGRTDDYNGPAPSGIGASQIFYRNGRRSGSASAYLRPASRRSNLTVMTDSTVEALLFADRRAIGVRFTRGGVSQKAHSREVILSAGAIGSPHLLELSGVGQVDRLRRHGLVVNHDLPAVGENLQDHYLAFVVQQLKGVRSLGSELQGWRALVNGAAYLLFKRGYMNGTPTQVNGHASVAVDGESVGVQFMGMPLSFSYDTKRKSIRQSASASLMLGVNVCRPKSRGHVHLTGQHLSDKPTIIANFLADRQDLRATVAGLKVCREILSQQCLVDIRAEESAPGPKYNSDAELEAYVRIAGASAYHPVGSCRMGTDPKTSVVNAALRVHGLGGLRIVDASVMPTLVSANTHAPTVMIGEKAADIIRNESLSTT